MRQTWRWFGPKDKVTVEDAVSRSLNPDDFMRRVANAQRGIFDDEDDVARKAKDQGGEKHGK